MKFCPQCGARLAADSRFCGSCGASLNTSSTDQPSERSSDRRSDRAASDAGREAAAKPLPGRPAPRPSEHDLASRGQQDDATQVIGGQAGAATTSRLPGRPAADPAASATNDHAGDGSSPQHPGGNSSWHSVAPAEQYPHVDHTAVDARNDPAGHRSNSDSPAYSQSRPGTRALPLEEGSGQPRGGYDSAPSQAPYEPPAEKGGSKAPKILAGVVAVALLAGGAYLGKTMFLDKDSGSDTSATSSAQPGQAGSSGQGGTQPATAPTAGAEKPKTMPDLKGKSLDEARSALGGSVKLETSAMNLVEGMNGGAVITAQEPKAGSSTPDTVKVRVDQPANVTYVTSSSGGVVVDSNPFTSDDTAVNGKRYDHGLGLTSYTTDEPKKLDLNLDTWYSRFRTDIVVPSDSEDLGKNITVTIKKDDSQVWNQRITASKEPVKVDLDVTGARRLTIEVSITGGDDSKDAHLLFGDMRLLAKPGDGPASSPTTSN